MSELITNLNAIYNTKLQIKAALNTESDNFSDYPTYISALGPQPTGYSYITTNGDFDISTYAMVNVNVPQGGGGVDYQWIDWGTSPVLTQGDKISFNGYIGSGDQITQQIINVYPALADYLGWYLYPVGGWDRSTSGTTPWEKYVLSKNQLSISQNIGVVVSGEILDITMGSATQKFTILEDINESKYAGGNGTKSITTNGTQQVVGYQSVSVNVAPQTNHDGLSEATAFTVDEAIEFINTLNPNTPTTDMYYVKGRISQVIYTIDSKFNTWRGYISNDGTTTNQLLVYGNGYGPDYQTVNWDENVNPQVKRGDSVIVYAHLQLYNNVPQTNNGYLDNHQRRVEGSPVNPITTNGVVNVQDYVSVNVNVGPTYNIIESLPESDQGWYFKLTELDGYSVPTGNVKYLFIKYNSSAEIISYNYNVDEILTATGFSDGSSLGLNIFYNGQGGITFGFENYVGSDSSNYINPLAFTQGETEVLRPNGGFYYGLGGNFDISDPKIFIWDTKVSIC